jgi:hypothetical protein
MLRHSNLSDLLTPHAFLIAGLGLSYFCCRRENLAVIARLHLVRKQIYPKSPS